MQQRIHIVSTYVKFFRLLVGLNLLVKLFVILDLVHTMSKPLYFTKCSRRLKKIIHFKLSW